MTNPLTRMPAAEPAQTTRAGQLAVMYHYVRDRVEFPLSRIHGLSAAAFTAQVGALLATHEPGAWLTDADDGPAGPTVLFTFDDTLADHLDVAAGVLEAGGARGVFFMSGRPFVEGRLLSAHLLHILLCYVGPDELPDRVWRWLARHDADGDWRRRLDRAEAHRLYHYEPPPMAEFKYLMALVLPIPLRDRMLDALFAEHVGSQREWIGRWYGSLDDWRALAARGHVIGGHGFTHEPLTRLSPDDAAADIARCAAFLREALGDAPRPFSYPFGRFDEATVEACRRAGFAAAFTTNEGLNTAATDRYRLHRVDTIAVDRFLGGSTRA